MGLFPKEVEIGGSTLGSAPKRMQWTRERGTRRLLLGLALATAAWFVATQAQDRMLLQKHWNPLTNHKQGLTLVGTLNSRDSYDRNLIKIITANKSSRVVLTEYGWKSVFDVRNGPMFEDRTATAIEAALKQDDVVGYAMLTPYLRAALRNQMGDTGAYKSIREELPIDIPKHTRNGADEHATLGALLRRYAGQEGREVSDKSESGDTGSNSGREKENTVTIPAETLIEACPIVLTDEQCTGAWIEELQGNLLTPTTYTVHLDLTPEGRSRFFQWSHEHVNENVVFVLNDQVVAAPRVTQTLNVSDFNISNLQDKKAAQSVVDYITRHDVKPAVK